MANLTAEAIAGLQAKGYTTDQIDAITKAAQTGGANAAKSVIAGFSTVTPEKPAPIVSGTPSPVAGAQSTTAPITDTKQPPAKVVSPQSSIQTALTMEQAKSLTPEQQQRVLDLARVGSPDAAKQLAANLYSMNQAGAVPGGTSTVNPDGTVTIKNTKKNTPGVAKPAAMTLTSGTPAPSTEQPQTPGADNILKQDQSTLNQTKLGMINAAKTSDMDAANNEYVNGAKILAKNNQNLLNLYGIDAEGRVDMNNKEGIAYKTQQAFDDYKASQDKLLSQYSGTRLAQVQGTIQQILGPDAANMPREKIIALSGQIGSAAFTDIYKATEQKVNNVQQESNKTLASINAMREKGIISTNDANTAIEMLRAKTLATQNAIAKQYSNDIATLAQDAITQKGTVASQLLQTASALGLSGTKLAVVSEYIGRFTNPAEALAAMVKDINNPNSTLAKNMSEAEKAKLAQAAAELQIKQTTANAAMIRANASAASATNKKSELSGTIKQTVAAWLKKPMSQVTQDDFDNLVLTVPVFRSAIAKTDVDIIDKSSKRGEAQMKNSTSGTVTKNNDGTQVSGMSGRKNAGAPLDNSIPVGSVISNGSGQYTITDKSANGWGAIEQSTGKKVIINPVTHTVTY